ncbi:MAG: phosphate transport system [Pseudomonadota bacterium]
MTQLNLAAKEYNHIQTLLERLSTDVRAQLRDLKQAASEENLTKLRQIVDRDREIDSLELDLNRQARSFIELRAPLGADFRSIMKVVEIASNLERIGDCTEYVARHIATSFKLKTELPEGWDLIANMMSKCLELLDLAHSAWQRTDVRLAERLPRQDEEVDALQKQARQLMIAKVRSGTIDVALGLELVLIANKLESIADISSHIAESVVFIVQARQIRHEKRKAPLTEPTGT